MRGGSVAQAPSAVRVVAPARATRRTEGAVLAELAIVALAIWLLLAGVLELGRAFSAQQILQHAVATIARELARQELPHDAGFEQALPAVLDPRFLVLDAELLARCGIAGFGEAGHDADLDRLFAERLPIGNRLLRPLMIRDRVGGTDMLRYPGAVLLRTDLAGAGTPDCAAGSRYAVGIPRLDEEAGRVTWLPVVEESPGPDPLGAGRAGFALRDGGWVGVRLHYPFQSAALPGARNAGLVDPTTGRTLQTLLPAEPVLVDAGLDALEAQLLAGSDGVAFDPRGVAAYAGPRGLGRLTSLPDARGAPRTVRPFRRLLSATAGFRREIFLPSGSPS